MFVTHLCIFLHDLIGLALLLHFGVAHAAHPAHVGAEIAFQRGVDGSVVDGDEAVYAGLGAETDGHCGFGAPVALGLALILLRLMMGKPHGEVRICSRV